MNIIHDNSHTTFSIMGVGHLRRPCVYVGGGDGACYCFSKSLCKSKTSI